MRLYLVRHGQTDMNKRNMFYGWTDADINETGIQQAEQLRQYFRQIPINAIYSSDLRRAAHTAEIIASGKDMTVRYDSAFRELYYGDWENQTTEYIEKNFKEELRGWVTDWKGLAMPNGESSRIFIIELPQALTDWWKKTAVKMSFWWLIMVRSVLCSAI